MIPRKITYLLLTLFFILLFMQACKKEVVDLLTGSQIEDIVWTVVSDSYANCTDPNSDGTETFTCTSSDCITIKFSNGVVTWTETVGGVTNTDTSSTYVLVGSTLTVSESAQTHVFTVTLSGNTLTLVGSGGDPGCVETMVLTK